MVQVNIDGQPVTFQKKPSPEDIAYVRKQMRNKKQPAQQPGQSFQQPQKQQEYSLADVPGQALKNLPGSIGNMIGGIGNAITHPLQTLEGVGRMGAGAIQSTPGISQLFDVATKGEGKEELNKNRQYFQSAVNSLQERYGGYEKLKKTVAEDPAGFLMDASVFLGGAESLLGKAGETTKIGAISKAGETASKIGGAVEPTQYIGKTAKAVTRGVSRIAGEAVGATTGVGYGSIKQFYNSIKAGGEEAKTAYDALRKQTSPEQVVNDAKSSLSKVYESRSKAYSEKLSKLTKPQAEEITGEFGRIGAEDALKKSLDSIDLPYKETEGKLDIDFTARPSLDSKGIKQVSDMVYSWKDTSVKGMNRLKQEIQGFQKTGVSLNSAENRFNKFISDTVESIDEHLKQNVGGYEEMNKEYQKNTQLIKDIERDLSLGNKKSIDTAYRKLSSVLRTNNEFRLKLADELNNLSGGKLLAEVAGGQMSELLPRGIIRSFEAGGALAGIVEGMFVPLLKVVAFTSPRVMGEFIGALGFTGRKAEQAMQIIKKISPTPGKDIMKAGFYGSKALSPTNVNIPGQTDNGQQLQ